MRMKTMNNLFDNVMWYLLYLMPLVLLIGVSIRLGSFTPLSTCFDLVGLNIIQDSIIFATLSSLFGVGGVLPLFASADILVYFTYFISVFIIHLAVDFVLFIPRLAHKWFNSFTSGGAG